MTQPWQVTTTTGAKEDADRIAVELIEQRLAACVQVSGPITSCFRWQGNVETASEWMCTIKTTDEAYDRVEELIRNLHPYDEPEIIVVPIVAGSQGYLRWLREQLDV